MKRLASLAVLSIVLGGCGSTTSHKTPLLQSKTPVLRAVPAKQGSVATPFVCHHKAPAELGECIKQELRAKGVALGVGVPSLISAGHQCTDISVWQGVPNFREAGVRCAIVQTNDGHATNSLFYAQTRELRNHGIPFGIYTFVEAYSGSSQAETAVNMARGQGATLGAWADAEVSGSYEHACAYVNYAHDHGFPIVGVYASPGNWPGYRCQGYNWPAEWGGGSAYPIAGYSYSSTVLRQFCGTCRLPGFGGEVDRDEDLGLLALVKPPPPPCDATCQRATKHRRLLADYRVRGELRADIITARHRINVLRVEIRKHQCARGDHRHAIPHGYRRACNRRLKEGQREHRVGQFWTGRGRRVASDIARLHREGIV